jgi:hypothetical protein
MVYLVLGRIPLFEDQGKVRVVVAFIIPLIGVRFINYEWLNTILLSYQVLAIALTAVLPFIIYFFFVHETGQDSPAIRKIAWIFFILVYIGLWVTTEVESYGAVYFWTIVISIALLLFDGTIHDFYMKQKMKSVGSENKWGHIAKIKRDIDDIQKSINEGHLPQRAGEKIIKKKQKRIKWIMKNM